MSLVERVRARLRLSRAKHRSLHGHARLALQLSRLLPFYEYDEASFLATDGAPPDIVARRRDGFHRLSELLTARAPRTLAASEELEAGLSDVAFVNA
jgi:glutamate-1-semialdehyde 2,1-aminomutase